MKVVALLITPITMSHDPLSWVEEGMHSSLLGAIKEQSQSYVTRPLVDEVLV